jgi:hypothetical protein
MFADTSTYAYDFIYNEKKGGLMYKEDRIVCWICWWKKISLIMGKQNDSWILYNEIGNYKYKFIKACFELYLNEPIFWRMSYWEGNF